MDRPCAGCPYLLPRVEAISLYDHVHEADVVAASGHCQGGFPLLRGRSKGSQSCYRRAVGWPLAPAANVLPLRKRLPVKRRAEMFSGHDEGHGRHGKNEAVIPATVSCLDLGSLRAYETQPA